VKKSFTESFTYDNLGDGWTYFMAACRWFPDFLADLCRADDANYQELPILHRINMRAKANYQYCDLTECRGAGKSFSSILEELTEQVTWPGISCLYVGPSNKQTAQIGSETYNAISHDYPVLTGHFQIDAQSKDSFGVSTPEFGSKFSITAARGINVSKVVAEEYAQEGSIPFDEEDYKQIVLPAVRVPYKVVGQRSKAHIYRKQHSITSAGRRQSYAYESRNLHLTMMQAGESAFVMDVPFDVILLNQMRPPSWAESLRRELTPDEFAREMRSLYTGTDSFPMVSDGTITDSRNLMMMEDHTCLKDADNYLGVKDVIYIIGYDVSYAEGVQNAKCACVVLKLTKQKELLKRDKYLKEVVWVTDWSPKPNAEQAKMLKDVWKRYCFEGADTFIAIDAWQYGSAVLSSLMSDLGDGLPPLCSYNHEFMTAYELDGSLPVIYPIKAGGVGVTDSDQDMVRYAQTQFEYRNVRLLTSNWQAGIEAYKRYHRIRDDRSDGIIYAPYKKTNELIGQIQNLKVINGAEKRISTHIQRDSWSALKYALRVAYRLELERLLKTAKKNDYEELLKQYRGHDALSGASAMNTVAKGRLITPRTGGRMF
jgi:hypothetical protein